MLHEDVLKVVDYWAAIHSGTIIYVRHTMDEVVMRAEFNSQYSGGMDVWWKFATGSKVVIDCSIRYKYQATRTNIESPEELRTNIKNFFFFTNYGGRPVKR